MDEPPHETERRYSNTKPHDKDEKEEKSESSNLEDQVAKSTELTASLGNIESIERAPSDETPSGSSTPSVAFEPAPENGAASDEDDEYDPESVNPSPEPELSKVSSPPKDNSPAPSDDEYDPEMSILPPPSEEPTKKETPKHLPNKPVLPAKPPASLAAKDPQLQLKEAYEAIMQSDLVKQPEFKQLTQEQQMALIDQQLKEKGIVLPQLGSVNDDEMNYDQVYSFNKPSDSRASIPLVPRNKFCKRPNLTLPMSDEEEAAYQEYLSNEDKYSNRRELDHFPDGSRLFIGNLSTNTVTKADLFRICRMYGEVVHITLKGGFGFVQYTNAELCAECIKGETDVPLHGRFMRWDASSGQKRSHDDGVRFREREAEEDSSTESTTADCEIFVTIDSTPSLVKETTEAFQEAGLTIKVSEIGDQDLSEVIPEAAYSGVLGACVVKSEKVDLQTFEEAEEGGIKFDEYVDLSPLVAVDLIKRVKPTIANDVEQTPDQNAPSAQVTEDSSNEAQEPYQPRKQRKKNHQKDRKIPRGSSSRNSSYGSQNYGAGGVAPYGVPPPPPPPYPSQPSYPPQPSYPAQLSYPPPPPPSYPPQTTQQYQSTYPNSVPQPPNQNSYEQNRYPQPGPAPQPPVSADVLQMLQGLDPATLQNVINIVQQQQQQQQQALGGNLFTPVAQPYMPNTNSSLYGQPPLHVSQPPPPPPHIQQPSQLNSLLTQLQTPQQYPGSSQPQQSAPQQPRHLSTLMDMLARLSKQ